MSETENKLKKKASNRNESKGRIGTENPIVNQCDKQRSKRGKRSDPVITTISELLSTSLSVISPKTKLNTTETDVDLKHTCDSDVKDTDKCNSSNDFECDILNRSSKELISLKLSTSKKKFKNANKANSDSEFLQFDETFKVKIVKPVKKSKKTSDGNGRHEGNDCVDRKLLNIHKNCNISNPNDDSMNMIQETNDFDIESHKQSKNAFQLMMNGRHKVIGRNSPGKDLEEQENGNLKENRQKLRARKLLLENWTIAKGSQKRQREEIEKEHYINEQLDRRAKKLKKLLSCNQNEEEINVNARMTRKRLQKFNSSPASLTSEVTVSNNRRIRKSKKRVIKIESDSDNEDSSNEIMIVNKVDLMDEKVIINLNESPKINCDDTDISDNTSEMQTKKYTQRGLLNFFDVLKGDKLEDGITRSVSSKRVVSPKVCTSKINQNEEDKLRVNKTNKSSSERYGEKKDLSKLRNDGKNHYNGKHLGKRGDNAEIKKKFKIKYGKGDIGANVDKDQLEDNENTKPEVTLSSNVRRRGRPKKLPQNSTVEDENTSNEPVKFTKCCANESSTIKSLKTCKKAAGVTDSTWIHVDLTEPARNTINEILDTEENIGASVKEEVRKSSRRCAMKLVDYTERAFDHLDASNDFEVCNFSEDSNDGIKNVKKVDKDRKKTVEVVHLCDSNVSKKRIKLAPIFAKSTPRPKLDPSVLEARKNFLRSGVPDSLKRKMEKQQTAEDVEHDVFPSISHIQQKTESPTNFWHLPEPNLKLAQIDVELPRLKTMRQGSVTARCDDERKVVLSRPPQKLHNLKSILKDIKTDNPEYPVHRSFRLLSEKCKKNKDVVEPILEIPDFAMWTEKYKAKNNDDIFGNQSSTSQLKKWLHSWLEYSDEVRPIKSKRRDSSTSDADSDEFDDDNIKEPINTMILTGPHGSGKTMTIYALCNEMGINVLELNASEKRTGKRLHQELQEATQSHQVRKNKMNSVSTVSQSKHRNTDQENGETSKRKICLLLVEDVDIVFDQDEGFLSVLSQLLTTSKRPIVLVTTDINSVHLQRFVAQYSVVKFSPLSPRVLSVWLQILCLLEGLKVERNCIDEMLEWNRGDVRKTLLQLQFWAMSGGSQNLTGRSLKQIESKSYLSLETESQEVVVHQSCSSTFVSFANFIPSFGLDKLWWSIPKILKFSPGTNLINFVELKSIGEIFESFAMADIVHGKLGQQSFEDCRQGKMKNSLELGECMKDYCPHTELAEDWTRYLLKQQIESFGNFDDINLGLPSLETQRRCSKQRSCGEKFLEIVPYSYHTDHRAVALDYFSTLRNVSRLELHRATTNNKRKNRFSNYLRTIGLNLDEATNKTACNILNKNSVNTELFI